MRGGITDKHSHGFGIAFHEGNDANTIVDTSPAATSPVADAIANCSIRTTNMISHIRYATQGEKSKKNAHPFQRKLWGKSISFCHNGDIPKFSSSNNCDDHKFQCLLGQTRRNDILYEPVGDTDSEAAFCAILDALKAEFATQPPIEILNNKIKELCVEIVSGEEETSIFNMLLA